METTIQEIAAGKSGSNNAGFLLSERETPTPLPEDGGGVVFQTVFYVITPIASLSDTFPYA